MTWLGLQLDSLQLTVALPAEKVDKALSLIQLQHCLVAKSVTRKQLDSLFGYLSFCSAVVFGGRAFLHGLRRLRLRSEGVLRAAHHRVNVNEGFREDMRLWKLHLRSLNGGKRIPIIAYDMPHERVEAYLDARVGDGGVGVFLNGGFVSFTGQECN